MKGIFLQATETPTEMFQQGLGVNKKKNNSYFDIILNSFIIIIIISEQKIHQCIF